MGQQKQWSVYLEVGKGALTRGDRKETGEGGVFGIEGQKISVQRLDIRFLPKSSLDRVLCKTESTTTSTSPAASTSIVLPSLRNVLARHRLPDHLVKGDPRRASNGQAQRAHRLTWQAPPDLYRLRVALAIDLEAGQELA